MWRERTFLCEKKESVREKECVCERERERICVFMRVCVRERERKGERVQRQMDTPS